MSADPSSILIRSTNWIGDAVMSLPAIHALRARYPRARITVLARPWVGGLYEREPGIDCVIAYPFPGGARELTAKFAAARALRRERFDWAVLLQNAFEAAALAFVAGARRRIGYDRDGRGFLLTDAVPVPRPGQIPKHERFYYLELLRRAGIIEALPDCDAIRLHGAEAAAESGRSLFERRGIRSPIIGVSPGAAYGTAKQWLPDRFAAAATQLARDCEGSVALFGSRGERELCDRIAQHIDAPVFNLAGESSLREFIDLAAACRLFLTNDSGAMHIASALGVPTITVYGATDPFATGPTGPLARVVRTPVACSPCLLRECPIDHRCMTGVSAERVAAEASELVCLAQAR